MATPEVFPTIYDAEAEPAVKTPEELFVERETEAAITAVDSFLDAHEAETVIVRAENYDKMAKEWNEVIGSTYKYLGVQPPLKSRTWLALGEYGTKPTQGWLSSIESPIKIVYNGKIMQFKLVDMAVRWPDEVAKTRPDGSGEKRILYLNRAKPVP